MAARAGFWHQAAVGDVAAAFAVANATGSPARSALLSLVVGRGATHFNSHQFLSA